MSKLATAGLETRDPAPWDTHRLWSLWDIMQRIQAETYLRLGERIHDTRGYLWESELPKPSNAKELEKWEAEKAADAVGLRREMERIHQFCVDLQLPVSTELILPKLKKLPKNVEEYDMVIMAIRAELRARLFLYVPEHRARYFEKNALVSDQISKIFPAVSYELREAANCLAVGFYTACVFHSMRGVEIGLKSLATSLGITFDFPIELADWANVVDKVEAAIRAMKDLPRSAEKDAKLHFYSEAAMQFRYFKDAWRVRVSHARENYDESQATSVLEHTLSFFETVAAPPSGVVIA